MDSETHSNKKCGGRQKRERHVLTKKKKTTCPVKKSSKKKKNFFRFYGPHGNRPFSPSRRSLRPGLPTRSTPPFAPHYDKRSSCALYNNHVKNPECTINFFSVLLAVLRYCPGSTAHRCPQFRIVSHATIGVILRILEGKHLI